MRIYERDFRLPCLTSETHEYETIRAKENRPGKFGRINKYLEYPEAVRHHMSLFPNNHIDLCDVKRRMDFDAVIDGYEQLIHDLRCRERDAQRYLKSHNAYYMILSLLGYYSVGNHGAYIFPEFSLGGQYIPDYLLIGKNSGGYEFIFVELEAPHGSIAIHDDHYLGKVFRDGENQVYDWKRWLEQNFRDLEQSFVMSSNPEKVLPDEFIKYDSTRVHFMVVAGTRGDFSPSLYRQSRDKVRSADIKLIHYDNIIDHARELKNKNSF